MIKTNTKNKIKTVALALLVMAIWGLLYPVMKMSYGAFRIAADDIPTIILFAGVRFALCGAGLAIISAIRDKKIVLPSKKEAPHVVLGTLFTVILQYSFIYIALAVGDSSKSAIIKQVGFLFLGCFAFLFDKSDKFSIRKLIAGLLGFAGIIVTSIDGSAFAFGLPEILLILSSASAAAGTVVAKHVTQSLSPVKYVAYTQLAGGVVLTVAGAVMGGKITYADGYGIAIFAFLCITSVVAYVIWNKLLKTSHISTLSIIKFAEPLFAVAFSGLLLSEDIFKITYLIALLLILAAILTENVTFNKTK